MDTKESQKGNTPQVLVDGLQPLITDFFARMTAEQWKLFQSGTPDDATMVLLAELLLELITSISKHMLSALKRQDVGSENLQTCLGSTVSQIFDEVLDPEDPVQRVGSKRLTKLMEEEVAERIQSAMATSASFEEPLLDRVTPPCRLNTMIKHACRMLKALAAKTKNLHKPQPDRKRRRRTISIETKNSEDHLELEDVVFADTDQSPVSSVESDTAEEEVSSEDSIVSEKSKAVQEIISKEVQAIIEPLLDEVSDSEYELLQSEASLEIKTAADDIAQLLSAETESLKATESARPSPRSQQTCKASLKVVRRKIKSFFAKRFAKASIHRIVAQVKTKFNQDSKVEGRESFQSFMARVDSLLVTEDDEKQKDGNEVCVFRRFKNITPSTVLVFTKELSDLLYNHIADEIIPEPIGKSETYRTVSVPESHANLYADIRNKVTCFLSMMGWWVKTQAGKHSGRVTLALADTESLATSQLPEVIVGEETAYAEKRKVYVRILVEKLFALTFRKSELSCAFPHLESIKQRMFEKTWAKVEGATYDITPETFKHLHKDVFKDLCEEWGCAENVLAAMSLGNPIFEKHIASTFKAHLTRPKQHYTISRLFSSMRKAVSNTVRWSSKFLSFLDTLIS